MFDFKKIQEAIKIAKQAEKQSKKFGKILNENNKILKKITQQLNLVLSGLKK